MGLWRKRSRKPDDGSTEYTVQSMRVVQTSVNGKTTRQYVLGDPEGQTHTYESPDDMPPGVRAQFDTMGGDLPLPNLALPKALSAGTAGWGDVLLQHAGSSTEGSMVVSHSVDTHQSVEFQFTCPTCGKTVRSTEADKTAEHTCPHCGTKIFLQPEGLSPDEFMASIRARIGDARGHDAQTIDIGDDSVEVLGVYADVHAAVRAAQALKELDITAWMVPSSGESMELSVAGKDASRSREILERMDLLPRE